MDAVIAFIDGFNLYHALDAEDAYGNKPYRVYKWLDYWSLCERHVAVGERLVAVYWFTAYVPWKSVSGQAKKARHRKLVAANKQSGVTVEWRKFRPITRRCHAECRAEYRTYEEKRTDVKIALHMQKLAYENAYNKGIVISADTDLAPAIEMVVALNPRMEFVNVVPIGQSSAELSRLPGTRQVRMSIQDLVASRLPDSVRLKGGGRLDCPAEWM